MSKKTILSVIIISYNQESYIRDAIDSVINQKTSYKYEIILADDCSTDNTGNIMEEYTKKYPNLITKVERKKNLGATQNYLDACLKSDSKYITFLEGDDYWIDNQKIQKQIDFLENNSEYIGIAHLQEGRNEIGEYVGVFPKWIKKSQDITIKDFEKSNDFSCSSCIYKNIFKNPEYLEELKYLLSLHRIVADLQLCYFLLSHGKVYVFNEPMMVYRIIKNANKSNYNSQNSISKINFNNLDILSNIDKKSNYKYNFFQRYLNYITIGFCINIISFKFNNIKKFFTTCPKKYRIKIIFYLPVNIIRLLINRRKK